MAGNNVGGIEADLTLRDQQFIAAINKNTAAVEKLSGGLMGLGKSSKTAEKSMGGLGSTMDQVAGAAVALGTAVGGFNLAEAAASAATAEKSFLATGGNIEKLRESVQGMVSDAELIRKRNLADTMGINEQVFAKLATFATGAAARTGQSFSHMFDSIVTGTARSSKMILDNLGILVSAEEANKRYAAANGLVAGSLTDVQKKAAFTEEVLRQGDMMMKNLGLSAADLVDPFAQARAAIANIGEDVGALLIPGFSKLIGIFLPLVDFVDKLRTGFDNLSPRMKDMVATASAIVIGLTTLVGVVGSVTAAFLVLKPVFIAVGAAISIMAAPLIKFTIIAMGAAAVAGALRAAWEDNLGGIQDKFKALKETALDVFNGIKGFMAEAGNFIASGFDTVWDGIIDGLTILPQAVGLVVEKVSGKVLDLILLVEKMVNKLAGTSIGKRLGLEGLDFGKAKSFANNLAQGGARFNAQIQDSVDLLKEFTNPRKLVATGIEGAGNTATTLADGLKTGGKFVARGWSLLWDDMKDGLKSFGVDFEKMLDKKIPDQVVKPKDTAAPGTTGGGPPAKVELIGDMPPGMADMGSGMGKGIERGLFGDIGAQAIGQEIAAVVQEAIGAIVDFVGAITGDERLAEATGAGLTAAVTTFAGTLLGLGATIGGAVAALVGAALLPLVVIFAPVIALFGALLLFGTAIIAAALTLIALPGIIAGVAAGFASLVTQTESFANLQAAFQGSMDRLISALEPMAEHFFAVAGLFDAFIDVAIAFADAFVNVEFIARGMFEMLKGVTVQLAGFALVIGNVQNTLLEFGFSMLRVVETIANMVGLSLPALADMRAGLLGMRVDTDALADAFVGLAELSYEDADQRARNLLLGDEQNDQLEESVNINVPEVFKLEAERFKAIQAGLGSSPTDLGLEGGQPTGAGGESNFYGDIYIDASQMSAQELLELMNNTRGQMNAEQSGNPNGRGSRSGGGL